MFEQYFSTTEVAEILNISPLTVTRYIREGLLRATKFPAGWLIPQSAIDDFFERYGGR